VKYYLDKRVALQKAHRVRDAPSRAGEPRLSIAEDGKFLAQYFNEQGRGKALLSSAVEQPLEKSLEMTQMGFCKTLISSKYFWIILRGSFSDSLVLRPY